MFSVLKNKLSKSGKINHPLIRASKLYSSVVTIFVPISFSVFWSFILQVHFDKIIFRIDATHLLTKTQARRERGGWGGFSPPSFWQINSPYLNQGTVFPIGFYADIWSQHQMQQYHLCLKSFLSNFGNFEVP